MKDAACRDISLGVLYRLRKCPPHEAVSRPASIDIHFSMFLSSIIGCTAKKPTNAKHHLRSQKSVAYSRRRYKLAVWILKQLPGRR
ncbi:unnamed protein product [Diplocarpon coronariae]